MLGEFVLPTSGGLWTATAIDVMARLGFSERNTRQALARLSDDDVLRVEHHGRRARWLLSESGRQLLAAGAERIYHFGERRRRWDGRWLLVLCSVPEAQRAKRRRFQTRMAFSGFGTLAPGIAISPHREAEGEANRIIADLGLGDLALVFVAGTGSLSPDSEILDRAWDLDELALGYRAFVDEFGPRQPADPGCRFEALTELVHAWRRFPFADPEIPARLLPPDWPGLAAEALFTERRRIWRPDAIGLFTSLDAAND